METSRFRQLLGAYSCVVEQAGKIKHELEGTGLRPLLWLVESHPDDLRGATVADKVIGRAAAALLITHGATVVYGKLMSNGARDWLREHDIELYYDELIPAILRRDRTGVCPMEQLAADCKVPSETVKKILLHVS